MQKEWKEFVDPSAGMGWGRKPASSFRSRSVRSSDQNPTQQISVPQKLPYTQIPEVEREPVRFKKVTRGVQKSEDSRKRNDGLYSKETGDPRRQKNEKNEYFSDRKENGTHARQPLEEGPNYYSQQKEAATKLSYPEPTNPQKVRTKSPQGFLSDRGLAGTKSPDQNGFYREYEAKKSIKAASTTSSDFRKAEHRANSKCMCQICTCHRPDHMCPINYVREGSTGLTKYQTDYVLMKAQKPIIFRAEDNLKVPEGPTGRTVYEMEYKKRYLPSSGPGNKELLEMIKSNNNADHLRNLASGANYPQAKSPEPSKIFEKPAKFTQVEHLTAAGGRIQKETAYMHDYPRYSSNYEGQIRVNYDNLKSDLRDIRFQGTSVYRSDFHQKPNSKALNDQIGEIIREESRMTHALRPDVGLWKQSEYDVEFVRKKVAVDHCPILDLPEPDVKHKRHAEHIFYDEGKHDWRH